MSFGKLFMPSERDRAVSALLDIRLNILRAFEFVSGHTSETFAADVRTVYAVTRALEIISEASRRLPSKIKDNHPNIPWVDMAGAGNVYRHDYEDIQERFLWMTLDKHLEPLLRVVENELSDLAS